MEQIDDSSFKQRLTVSVEENIEMTRELLVLVRQIHSYMRFAKITAFIQLLLIVAPFVLGALFLPQLMKSVSNLTGSLPMQIMQQGGGEEVLPTNYDLNSLIEQYQQMQKQY